VADAQHELLKQENNVEQSASGHEGEASGRMNNGRPKVTAQKLQILQDPGFAGFVLPSFCLRRFIELCCYEDL